jgi:hypothetical protein
MDRARSVLAGQAGRGDRIAGGMSGAGQMGGMRDDVARNIERYGRLPKLASDPEKLHGSARLLDDARAELQYPSPRDAGASPDEARRWRAKSEECGTIAESCRSESARETFLRLAGSYAILAERAESRGGAAKPAPLITS